MIIIIFIKKAFWFVYETHENIADTTAFKQQYHWNLIQSGIIYIWRAQIAVSMPFEWLECNNAISYIN